jgi:hypothetical protein
MFISARSIRNLLHDSASSPFEHGRKLKHRGGAGTAVSFGTFRHSRYFRQSVWCAPQSDTPSGWAGAATQPGPTVISRTLACESDRTMRKSDRASTVARTAVLVNNYSSIIAAHAWPRSLTHTSAADWRPPCRRVASAGTPRRAGGRRPGHGAPGPRHPTAAIRVYRPWQHARRPDRAGTLRRS